MIKLFEIFGIGLSISLLLMACTNDAPTSSSNTPTEETPITGLTTYIGLYNITSATKNTLGCSVEGDSLVFQGHQQFLVIQGGEGNKLLAINPEIYQ